MDKKVILFLLLGLGIGLYADSIPVVSTIASKLPGRKSPVA